MKIRIITSIVALAFIVPFFVFADVTTPQDPLNYLFPLLFSLIAFVSVWEMLHCLKQDKNYVISVPLYLAALAFPMLARVLCNDLEALVKIAVVAALAIAVYMFFSIVFHFGQFSSATIGLVFMTAFYIIGSNTAIVVLRNTPKTGKFLVLIPFLLSWTTDIFAYFTGRFFGKHKLIEAVSPKKTVEGAIGGLVFCSLAAMLYGLIVGHFYDVTPDYLILALGGIVMGVVSQLGDLVMSAIKREQGIKDYGFMLPGHGGLLDRFDSSMAVTVAVLVITLFHPIFS